METPALAELTAAAAALAIGAKRKALLPLATAAIEYALVRRGDSVLVSCYGTASAPVVYQLDRAIPLRLLLDTCAQSMLEMAGQEIDPTARQIAIRVSERALATKITPDPEGLVAPMNQRGGELDTPGEHVAPGLWIRGRRLSIFLVFPRPIGPGRRARASFRRSLVGLCSRAPALLGARPDHARGPPAWWSRCEPSSIHGTAPAQRTCACGQAAFRSRCANRLTSW